jgi:hypothetical protein
MRRKRGQAHAWGQGSHISEQLAEDEAQLARALRDIDAEDAALARAGQPRSPADKLKIIQGAMQVVKHYQSSSSSSTSCAGFRCR